ncbi:MAG: tRNA lysidine(34) synthetase TilS [Bacteroidota bacterium]|nr:tRNA lysidine(34) synthetase TilS [Bacteroidota bacterium]
MQQKVQTYIQKHQLLDPKDRIIVGVSGGADSVVLLHVLLSLGYDCIIAHCNFHLRMQESDRDELFVRNLANDLKVPYYSIDFDTIKYADEQKISIEMAARDLRYAWFYELLYQHEAQAIAVAHHADDSIETLLMNLIRGTGLRGLTGIQPRNHKVVRPLLCCTRLEIEAYLVHNDLDHIEDSTNATIDYQRNRFRLEVLPLLTEINPAVRQTLYDSLDRFEGVWAVYQQAIDRMKQEVIRNESGIIKMDIDSIKRQVHVPTLMYELLHPFGFGPALIAQITEQLDGESGKVFFSDSHRLLKDRKFLILSEIEEDTAGEYPITERDTIIEQPFSLKINKLLVAPGFQVSKELNRIHVDASRLAFPLLLRRWQEGDTFCPFGMKQRKKVSNFFIDNKLSLLEKKHSWMLVSNGEIVWIVGQRMDNRFRVTKDTTEVIEFTIPAV